MRRRDIAMDPSGPPTPSSFTSTIAPRSTRRPRPGMHITLPDPTSPTSPTEASDMSRYPAVRSSTGSSDSQHDIPTAVNTPWAHTPSCSTGDLTRGKDKDDKDDKDDTDWESPAEMTQEEMELRERSKEEGKAEHQGEVGVGVNERKEMLDLGNGLEEVIIIDWLPGDPRVCGTA